MNRAQFRRQLQLGLNTNFGLEYKRHSDEWRPMFDVERSFKSYEEDVLLVGFGLAKVKPEGRGVDYDEGFEGWAARYTHETIALAFSITEEAEEDGLYGQLGKKYAKALALAMWATKEVKGAAPYNNGHDTDFKGGDGKPLFSTSHPLAGGGSFSNKLATPADLSEPALEDATTQIEGFVDERNVPCAIMPRRLIVGRQLRFIAHRLLQSTGRPGTGDNDPNAIKDMGIFPDGVHINHRLTSAKQWNIKTDCQDGMKHFVRIKIKRKVEGDFDSGNMRYRARERYIFGWTNPRGAFSSQGT